jgi:predicted Zn-dependent protease
MTITWRYLGAFGVVACVALAGCSSKAERIESGLRKAAMFASQSDWDKANVEVRNVLQIDPKNAQAYFVAGQVQDGKSDIRSAYANYTKAIELKPDHVQAKLGLARLYLLVNDTAQADKLIAEILRAEPSNIRGRTLKVGLLARQGNTQEALSEARRIIESGESLPADSSLLLAGLYVNTKDFDRALSLLDKALATDSKNIQLLQMAAEVATSPEASAGLASRGDSYFQAASREKPKNTEIWKAWALSHIRRNDLNGAESVLRKSILVDPDDTSRSLALIGFLAGFRGADAAEKELVSDIANKPKDTALLFAYAELLRRQNRVVDLKRTLDEIVGLGKNAPSGITARGQLAALSLAAGKVDEARLTLAELLTDNPRDAAGLVLRGRISLSEGKAGDAVIDFRAAAKDLPGSAEIASLLAQAHRAENQPQLAREVLVDAVKFNAEDPQLHLLVASDMVVGRDYKAALVEVDEAIKLAPAYLRAYEMKFELASSQGDKTAAEKTAIEVTAKFPQSPVGSLLLGGLYASQKRTDAALKQFDSAAKIAPAAAEPVVAAVGLLMAEQKFDDARARVDALATAQPKSPLPHQLRAEIALSQGEFAKAEQSFSQVISAGSATAAAYKNWAFVRMAMKDLPGAMTVLDQGEKALPDDETLPLARAEWLAKAGRTEDAISTYETLLKRAPNNRAAANNLAVVLAEVKGDKESVSRALQIASRFESSTFAGELDTLGMVQYRAGQFGKAVNALQRAVDLEPGEALLQLHLGMALYKNGDVRRGKELVRKAIDSKAALPNVLEARSLIAQG